VARANTPPGIFLDRWIRKPVHPSCVRSAWLGKRSPCGAFARLLAETPAPASLLPPRSHHSPPPRVDRERTPSGHALEATPTSTGTARRASTRRHRLHGTNHPFSVPGVLQDRTVASVRTRCAGGAAAWDGHSSGRGDMGELKGELMKTRHGETTDSHAWPSALVSSPSIGRQACSAQGARPW
jgi:hypothetical protein